MGKKCICLFLLSVFMLVLPWHSASAETATNGNLNEAVIWAFQDGTLTLSGEGDMNHATTFEVPWYHLREKITTVIVEEGILEIGSNAFENCVNLTQVQLPSTLVKIGSDAFFNCQSLTKVTIPQNVEWIYDSAFRYCTDLKSITIPDSVEGLGASVFKDCYRLQEVILSGELEQLPPYAFAGCHSLSEIVVPEHVTRIGASAFKNCVGLTQVQLPGDLGYIDDCVFYGCSSLASLEFPSGVMYFGDEVFRNCDTLTEIRFLGNMPSIGEDFFDQRGNEESPCIIYYPKDNKTWTVKKRDRWVRKYTSEIQFSPCEPTGCNHEVVIGQGRAATCTEAGLTDIEYCAICKKVLKEQTVIEPLGHDFEVTVIAPTCIAPGHERHQCRRCRLEERHNEVATLDHSFGDWVTVKESSEDEEGLSQRVCTACGETEQRTLEKLPPPPTEPTTPPPTDSAPTAPAATEPASTGTTPPGTAPVQPETPATQERREAGVLILVVLLAIAGVIFLVKWSTRKRM